MSPFQYVTAPTLSVFPSIKKLVFFTGTTALVEGQGLCYDRDRGTAANIDVSRATHVELPTTSNNRAFAGVTTQPYPADSAGQWIHIYEPGSYCNVAVGVDTVVNTTIMTCSVASADAGRFTSAGFMGRGTAIALQTNASGVLASSYDATGALDSAGLVITDTAAFAGLAASTTYDCYIVAGENDGTNTTTVGKYSGTYTTDDTFTLTSSASSGGTMEVSYYIQAGNQMCFAYLCDGDESGLQEILSPLDNAATQHMVGGFTYIHGGGALANGNATSTLADGTRFGELKGFKLLAAMTTNDWVLTVTNGFQQKVLDEVTTGQAAQGGPLAFASAAFDAANDYLLMQWGGVNWREIDSSGITIAAS